MKIKKALNLVWRVWWLGVAALFEFIDYLLELYCYVRYPILMWVQNRRRRKKK
jgi:hypothetical protein